MKSEILGWGWKTAVWTKIQEAAPVLEFETTSLSFPAGCWLTEHVYYSVEFPTARALLNTSFGKFCMFL